MHPLQLLRFAPFMCTVLAASDRSQYCYSSQNEPSSFCVSFSRFQNHTSGGTDLYFAFSALPTTLGGGWSAIGIGDVMAGSLMFILWADQKKEDVGISIRTATAHTEPYSTSDLPQVNVLQKKASKYESHKAVLVCYSCEKWASLDFHDKAQPWIWASNYLAEFQATDPDQYLSSHQLHDVFYVDMTAVPSAESSGGVPILPRIEGLTNSGTWDQSRSISKSTPLGASFWHGVAMTVAFMGIMMPSAIYKRWKANTRSHLPCQVAGSALAIVALGLGLWAFRTSGSLVGLHQILGVVASCLIILQIFFGAQILTFSHGETAILYRTLHRWLGRCVLALGISEIGLGLAVANAASATLIVWLGCSFAELATYWFVEPGAGNEKSEWHNVFRYGRGRQTVDRVSLPQEDPDLSDLVEEEELMSQSFSKPT